MAHGNLMHPLGDPRHAEARIDPHPHRGRPRVRVLTGQRDFQPPQTLPVGDDANILALGLQNRTLFDVQFQHRMHLAGANLFGPFPTNTLQFLAKDLAVHVAAALGIVLGMDPGKDARSEHGRCKARAFLIGPVGHHHRMLGLDAKVIHRPHHFQGPQNPKHPVIFPARRLGIQMAAHIDRQRRRVRSGARGKHIAHRVHAHGHARRFAPTLKQVATLAIGVSQGLAVAAPGHPRPDQCHLLKAVPKTRGINADILARCGHSFSPRTAGVLMPLAANLFLTVWSR